MHEWDVYHGKLERHVTAANGGWILSIGLEVILSELQTSSLAIDLRIWLLSRVVSLNTARLLQVQMIGLWHINVPRRNPPGQCFGGPGERHILEGKIRDFNPT